MWFFYWNISASLKVCQILTYKVFLSWLAKTLELDYQSPLIIGGKMNLLISVGRRSSDVWRWSSVSPKDTKFTAKGLMNGAFQMKPFYSLLATTINTSILGHPRNRIAQLCIIVNAMTNLQFTNNHCCLLKRNPNKLLTGRPSPGQMSTSQLAMIQSSLDLPHKIWLIMNTIKYLLNPFEFPQWECSYKSILRKLYYILI